ncbi:Rieske protein [Skeletonema marinoi]|uniref:Rieske protein n=1 Tax=Skeletonema marinoi TaxID=267567 RepID=A0AAD8XXL6_9STRA|nr:Rieske protein [Skeletonema marinoi]
MVAKTLLQSHHLVAVLAAMNYMMVPLSVEAFSSSSYASTCNNCNALTTKSTISLRMAVAPPPGGIALEDENAQATTAIRQEVVTEPAEPSPKRVGINSRGAKMNEIDFTLAPSDVSLSRCYQMAKDNQSTKKEEEEEESESSAAQSLSLTRALNTASNRAVRRILLARSWPSAEALNLSLRTVLMQQQQQQQQGDSNAGMVKQEQRTENGEEENDKMKCPVPRPILNILVKNRRTESDVNTTNEKRDDPTPRTSKEREELWIANQIAVFRESYNTAPGYDQAEAYLESILGLATSGVESDRVKEVFEGGVYVEPYRRVLSVIQSVGAVLENDPNNNDNKKRIAKKLIDRDICLSMLDKVMLANENKRIEHNASKQANPLAIPYDAAARLAYEADETNKSLSFEDFKEKYETETVAMVAAKKSLLVGEVISVPKEEEKEEEMLASEEPKGAYEKGRKRRLFREFWSKLDKAPKEITDGEEKNDDITNIVDTESDVEESSATPTIVIKPDDLGGVLLSAEEPTMTRQLNVLSNIVERTLIFGGDQELLVLAETLDADKPAFIQRWYSNDQVGNVDVASETRPGVQYLNALIRLLRDCYAKGVLKDIRPVVPLTTAYMNAYARLTASLVGLGSDYIRPSSSNMMPLTLTTTAAAAKYLTSTAPPKSARDELDRFAKWESTVRKNYDNNENQYPDDLIGTWDVQDVVGGSVIGSTKVALRPQGEVIVKPPMQGLRWRLDPGPTHLDTCTFQVLSDDGAILQYKGFVDRGSRLEARVSKRSVTLRGGVSFLMRDADGGGGDDMLPMNYKSGLTKFVMSRDVNGGDASVSESYSAEVSLTCPAVLEGEREIIDGPNGPILVTKVAGTYYAVDAKCPHLNLPMKKGKISVEGGVPTLTCNFHNSCFEMKSGKCTKWVTGALGNQNELIGGIMSSVGSKQNDIVAYSVSEAEDGTLVVTSQK